MEKGILDFVGVQSYLKFHNNIGKFACDFSVSFTNKMAIE